VLDEIYGAALALSSSSSSPPPQPPSLSTVDDILNRIRKKRESWRSKGLAPDTITSAMNGKLLICGEGGLHRLDALEGVTHVVSLYGEDKPKLNAQHLSLQHALDAPWYPLLAHFHEVHTFLKNMSRALLHCHQGINRSAAMLIALRMEYHSRTAGKSPEELLCESWQSLSEHRGEMVVNNPGFQRQLCIFAHLLCSEPRVTAWPQQWGPETWMPKVALDSHMVLAYRLLYQSYKKHFNEEKDQLAKSSHELAKSSRALFTRMSSDGTEMLHWRITEYF